MITKKSLRLFREASVNVPAYKEFLDDRGFDPKTVKSAKDFANVPITSKQNYLKQYPLDSLLWSGTMNTQLIFCSTSGSTGEPFYFPRSENLSVQYSYVIEDYLKARNTADRTPTLMIDAFGMGVWIGGIITMRGFEIAAQRMKYPLSILPVGYNKTEVVKSLRQLAPKFKQVIIVGYPPFVKEIIDECEHESIDLKKMNVRLFFAAESFTESFRDYLCKKTGADPVLDTMNIYGTADIGAMAYETPLSIFIRRQSIKKKALFKELFGQIEKTPTLAQYNPAYMTFEQVEGEVILTGNSAVPLVRYAVGDNGGVLTFEHMKTVCKKHGVDIDAFFKTHKLLNLHRHPFVFVYERKNFSVSLHGINIYPEFIKEGLLSPELIPYLTDKFTMITKSDNRHNQYLEINLELKKGLKSTPRIKNLAKRVIRKTLVEKSSEFAEISKLKSNANVIRCELWPADHPKYFTPGVKQKWVMK